MKKMPPRGKLRRGLRPGSKLPHRSSQSAASCCIRVNSAAPQAASSGTAASVSGRPKLLSTARCRAGLRRRPLPEPKQPPGGRTSGFERSAVTGGKLVRHAAQQSVQQGNGGKILLIQSAEHGRAPPGPAAFRQTSCGTAAHRPAWEPPARGAWRGRRDGQGVPVTSSAVWRKKRSSRAKLRPPHSGAPVSSQPPGKGRVSSPGTVRRSFVKNENWLPVPMLTSGASSRPCPAPRKLA